MSYAPLAQTKKKIKARVCMLVFEEPDIWPGLLDPTTSDIIIFFNFDFFN
jgi:hypothetical protein